MMATGYEIVTDPTGYESVTDPTGYEIVTDPTGYESVTDVDTLNVDTLNPRRQSHKSIPGQY